MKGVSQVSARGGWYGDQQGAYYRDPRSKFIDGRFKERQGLSCFELDYLGRFGKINLSRYIAIKTAKT